MVDDAAPLLPPPGSGLPDINRGPEILIVCGILTAVSFVFVIIRFWVRYGVSKDVAWDDYLCLLSWVVVFIEMMLFIPEVEHGGGRHVAYINPPSDVPKGLKLNFVTQPLSVLAVTLVKLSIGMFLLRITPSHNYGRVIWGVIAFTALSCVAHLFLILLQCRPISLNWGVGEGTCMPPSQVRLAALINSGIGIFTDVVFSLLPIPMLYKLQMRWQAKFAVCAVLSLGIFACAAAFVKIVYMFDYGRQGDFLYDSANLTIWTTVETCVGIVAACSPCLRPLFKTVFKDYYARSGPTLENSLQGGYLRSTRNDGRSNRDFEMRRREDSSRNNGSEESILPSVRDKVHASGIVKTTQVMVDSRES